MSRSSRLAPGSTHYGTAGRTPSAVQQALIVCAAVVVGIGGQVAASGGAVVEAAPLGPVSALGSVALAATLWWRHRAPLRALCAALAVIAVFGVAVPPGLYTVQIAGVLVVGLYAVGSWCNAVRRAVALVAAMAGLLVVGAAADSAGWASATALGLAVVGLPAVAGYAARIRRRYVEEVELRLAAAEAQRDERARLAVNAERARLARELHDVVAHHVSLIGVQAGAARLSVGRNPELTKAALNEIESSSRQAVAELRQLLDVLRPLQEGPGTSGGSSSAGSDPVVEAPQPTLAQLPSLIERWRRWGLGVSWPSQAAWRCPAYNGEIPAKVQAPVSPVGNGSVTLSPALSATCYRLVEEALTNVVKHGDLTAVTVDLWIEHDTLRLAVHNEAPTGSATAARPASNGSRHASKGRGHGLRGMAERVALFGGQLVAGPTADGGFLVMAALPLGDPPPGVEQTLAATRSATSATDSTVVAAVTPPAASMVPSHAGR